MSKGLQLAVVIRVDWRLYHCCCYSLLILFRTLGLGSGGLRSCDPIVPSKNETKARKSLCHSQSRRHREGGKALGVVQALSTLVLCPSSTLGAQGTIRGPLSFHAWQSTCPCLCHHNGWSPDNLNPSCKQGQVVWSSGLLLSILSHRKLDA